MTWAEVEAVLRSLMGRRVRVTHPNGFQRVGVVGLWREYVALDGSPVSGEFAGAVAIEVMLGNGRYAPVEIATATL